MTPDQIRARHAEGMAKVSISRLYGISLRQVENAISEMLLTPLNIAINESWEACGRGEKCVAGDQVVYRFTDMEDAAAMPLCRYCGVPMRKNTKGYGRRHNVKRPKVWVAA